MRSCPHPHTAGPAVTGRIVQDYLRSLNGIAVAWMGYRWALERAVELGCNLFVTHEPIYYGYNDNDDGSDNLPATTVKREFLEKSRLTVLRCHDLWDQYPEHGIPDTWVRLHGRRFYLLARRRICR